MPCRSYDDDFRTTPDPSIIEKLDMLSRIACKALEHIEASGDGLEILILKDPEVAKWWSAHKEADRKAKAAEAAGLKKAADAAARERQRNAIKARLTPAELKILGVK
jgi:hypothetical protein